MFFSSHRACFLALPPTPKPREGRVVRKLGVPHVVHGCVLVLLSGVLTDVITDAGSLVAFIGMPLTALVTRRNVDTVRRLLISYDPVADTFSSTVSIGAMIIATA